MIDQVKTNETFHAPNGDGTLSPEDVSMNGVPAWAIVWTRKDGTRKVGKSTYPTRMAALDTLRGNSTRV